MLPRPVPDGTLPGAAMTARRPLRLAAALTSLAALAACSGGSSAPPACTYVYGDWTDCTPGTDQV